MAHSFARAIIKPSFNLPTRKVNEVRAYRARGEAGPLLDMSFEPLITLYLTDHTTPAEIARAKRVVSLMQSSATRPDSPPTPKME